MSKVNQIQAELQQIDQAKFQELCDLYLRSFPQYADLRSVGTVAGEDKVAKGTPDSIITLPDGKYALANYTTQKSNLIKKLKKDFEKCFEEKRTRIPVSEISEIIFCHNRNLSVKDEKELIELARARGVRLTVRGQDKISYDLYSKLPALAKDYLDVEVDTGQILTPAQFVQAYNKSALSTPLDTPFMFREKDVASLVESLATHDIALIIGRPGVGKSRLMLQVASEFIRANSEYNPWSIFDRGVNIFQDIRSYFSRNGHYLLLIDDANRLIKNSSLEHVLRLLHEQTSDRKFKIIMTVRDYAVDTLRLATKAYEPVFYKELGRLTDNEIGKLVESATDITSIYYLRRIQKVAQGNPRLAMMASRLARTEGFERITDVSDLYDQYFESSRQGALRDEDALKVACIVSFFRVVDKSNDDLMLIVSNVFGLQASTFWDWVVELNREEVFDLHENEVVRFSDQILATYLFYLVIFKEKLIPFSIFIEHLFPRFNQFFIDTLDPVLNSLGAKDVPAQISSAIDAKWRELEQSEDPHALFALIRLFWFSKQTETLLFIRREIERLPQEQADLSTIVYNDDNIRDEPPLLSILGLFYHTGNFRSALTLALDYSQKCLSHAKHLIHLLKNDFGFTIEGHIEAYEYQSAILDELWIRAENGTSTHFAKILLATAKYYLRTRLEQVGPSDRKGISWTTFTLPCSDDLINFRTQVWDRVFALASVPALRNDALDVLLHYAHHGLDIEDPDIIRSDSLSVRDFLRTSVDTSDYFEASIALDFYKFLDSHGVSYDKTEVRRLQSPATQLALILAPDRRSYHEKSFEEQEAEQATALRRLPKQLKKADLAGFFDQCIAIHRTLHNHNKWRLKNSISRFFTILGEERPKLFVIAIRAYLDLGDPLSLPYSRGISSRLIQLTGPTKAISLISERSFTHKPSWLFETLTSIPSEDLRPHHIEAIYDIYRTGAVNTLPTVDSRTLENCLSVDPYAVAKITRILLDRLKAEVDLSYIFPLTLLFNPHVATNEKLASYFQDDDFSVFKEAYPASQLAKDHSDYDGRVFSLILDLDPKFLREYLELVALKAKALKRGYLGHFDARNFTFLWMRDDFQAIISDAVQFLYDLNRDEKVYVDFYLPSLFCATHDKDDEKIPAELVEKRVKVLNALIAEQGNDDDFMHFVFTAVGELTEDERRRALKEFLLQNKRVEAFKRLHLESHSKTYWGSAVPLFQKDYDFLESILPMLQGVEFLEQKLYLERRLEALRRYIESEKKRDFMRD